MRLTKFACAFVVLFVLSLFGTSQLRASGTDTFTYTAAGNTFVWTLPSSPNTLPTFSADVGFFTLASVSFTQNGTPMTGTLDFFDFTGPLTGGFDLYTGGATGPILVDAFGPQLFAGSDNAPTFLTGTFSLTDFGDGIIGVDPSFPGTLVITGSSTTVAEPSALLLLASGLTTLIGLSILRKS